MKKLLTYMIGIMAVLTFGGCAEKSTCTTNMVKVPKVSAKPVKQPEHTKAVEKKSEAVEISIILPPEPPKPKELAKKSVKEQNKALSDYIIQLLHVIKMQNDMLKVK